MLPAHIITQAYQDFRQRQSTDPDQMWQALMDNPEWESPKGQARWREDGAVVYDYSTWIVEGKGADERTSSSYDKKFDYAKIVDVYDGDSYVPSSSKLGY